MSVLDASAVLALLQGEPGAERIANASDGAVIGTVNLSEVIAKLCEHGIDVAQAFQIVAELPYMTVDFDAEQARIAAELREATRHRGLSLGDRACLALAKARGQRVFTADRAWRELNLGIEIEVIR